RPCACSWGGPDTEIAPPPRSSPGWQSAPSRPPADRQSWSPMLVGSAGFFLVSLSALFFVVDPLGLAPVFLALPRRGSPDKRRKAAKKATTIFFFVVSFFALGGSVVFDLLGVSLAAFKVAGGLLLLLTALDMLRSKQSDTRTSDQEIDAAARKEDIAIVPLAMPLLAGPGSIATAVVLTSRANSWLQISPVVVAVAAAALLTSVFLRRARVDERLLGTSGLPVLERGVRPPLPALALQFVVAGLGEAVPGLLPGPGA